MHHRLDDWGTYMSELSHGQNHTETMPQQGYWSERWEWYTSSLFYIYKHFVPVSCIILCRRKLSHNTQHVTIFCPSFAIPLSKEHSASLRPSPLLLAAWLRHMFTVQCDILRGDMAMSADLQTYRLTYGRFYLLELNPNIVIRIWYNCPQIFEMQSIQTTQSEQLEKLPKYCEYLPE